MGDRKFIIITLIKQIKNKLYAYFTGHNRVVTQHTKHYQNMREHFLCLHWWHLTDNVKDSVVCLSCQIKVNSVDYSNATSDEVASNLWAITSPVLNDSWYLKGSPWSQPAFITVLDNVSYKICTRCFCGGFVLLDPGGRLNKKDGLTRYGDSHVKDKTS